jgi:hypothetical protein
MVDETELKTYLALGQPKYMPRITFDGFGLLQPQDDITALEAANLAILLVYVTVGSLSVDCNGFIEKHGLQRHFVKE